MRKLLGLADFAGMTAAFLCLVHCLAMPLLLAAFPLLGLAGDGEALHDALLLGAAAPALLALVPGYLRHREAAAVSLGLAGLGMFLLAAFLAAPRWGESAETAITVLGSILLLSAHLRNRRCRQGCVAKAAH
jgi:hypothetical protein